MLTDYNAISAANTAATNAGHVLDTGARGSEIVGIGRDGNQTIVYLALANGYETVAVVFDGSTVDFIDVLDNDDADAELEMFA
jgi:hypothetical protein